MTGVRAEGIRDRHPLPHVRHPPGKLRVGADEGPIVASAADALGACRPQPHRIDASEVDGALGSRVASGAALRRSMRRAPPGRSRPVRSWPGRAHDLAAGHAGSAERRENGVRRVAVLLADDEEPLRPEGRRVLERSATEERHPSSRPVAARAGKRQPSRRGCAMSRRTHLAEGRP